MEMCLECGVEVFIVGDGIQVRGLKQSTGLMLVLRCA